MNGKVLTGRTVFLITASFFLVIIGVNFTMAYMAVSTFPGLEVKNSYVASQVFDTDRAAQLALGWDVDAQVSDGELRLVIQDKYGLPVHVVALDATLGRATHMDDDQIPDFSFDGAAYIAPVDLAPGNWNLRVLAVAPDQTQFRQRIVLYVRQGG